MELPLNGSSNSNMWIITLLPDRLPGRVRKKLYSSGHFIIDPLLQKLPLKDGTLAESFFAPCSDSNDASVGEEDYVTFRWRNPGQRGYDQIRQEDGDPVAVDIKVVSEEQARQLADQIRERLAEKLHHQLKQEQYQLQQTREKVAQQIEELAHERTQQLTDELNRKEESLTHCIGYFLISKLLPRISFIKSSASDQITREDLCKKWFHEIDVYENFGIRDIVAPMQEQLNDERRRNVRYWG